MTEAMDPARQLALRRLRAAPPGTRFTVRWALPADDASGRSLTDTIGELAAPDPEDPEAVTLRTRRGAVRIPWTAIRLARPVPPPAPRRRARRP